MFEAFFLKPQPETPKSPSVFTRLYSNIRAKPKNPVLKPISICLSPKFKQNSTTIPLSCRASFKNTMDQTVKKNIQEKKFFNSVINNKQENKSIRRSIEKLKEITNSEGKNIKIKGFNLEENGKSKEKENYVQKLQTRLYMNILDN